MFGPGGPTFGLLPQTAFCQTLAVVERADLARNLVVGPPNLHIEALGGAPGEIAAPALGLGLALLVLDVDAPAGPDRSSRDCSGRRWWRSAECRHCWCINRDAGARRRDHEHRRRFAMELALRCSSPGDRRLKFSLDLPVHAGIHAPEFMSSMNGRYSRKNWALAKVPLVTTQPLRAIRAVDLHVERNHRAVAPDPVHVDALEVILLLAVHRIEVEMQARRSAGTRALTMPL